MGYQTYIFFNNKPFRRIIIMYVKIKNLKDQIMTNALKYVNNMYCYAKVLISC